MKKMMQLLALVLSMLLLFTGCQTTTQPAINNDVETTKEELVIGYTIYEPMNYLDENGELTGFDTEFAEAVCEKLNMTPKFVEINWDTKFVTLDADQIDCIWNGMTISDEVKTNCLVSDAYVKNAQVVVMAKDKIADYTTVDSLKGLKFAAEAGSAGEQAIIDNGLDANYTPVAAQTDALMALAAGQADACVIDITMAKASTAPGTSYEAYTFGVELTTEEYGIGFRLADTELQASVNNAIKELYEDGTLTALAEKYELNLAF